MKYKGLTLDKFQEDAIHAIEKNHSVMVSAPTGSGKTLIADYIINRDIPKAIRVVYTSPIKALSNQKYKEFCQEYGEDQVGLLTGDRVINPKGTVLIMTTEIYRNMVLIQDKTIADISYVIFDEIHFINDRERGHIWEESIIFSPDNVRFVCLSATIPNAKQFAEWIEAIKGHKVETIHHTKRVVPLDHKFFDSELGICTLDELKEVADIPQDFGKRRRKRWRQKVRPPNHLDLIEDLGPEKTPCIYFNFSRKMCEEKAWELGKSGMLEHNKEIGAFLREKMLHAPADLNKLKTTKILRQTLPMGIGFHHAGLIPLMKDIVEELFSLGLLRVLYATDTFAVGINMPAKTVCFNSLHKYDGIQFRFLNTKEYFQCAGRAGRRGIDKHGFVFSMIDRRDFNHKVIKRLTYKDIEPIQSQFKLSYNTVLNLIDQHPPEEIDHILKMSFYSYQKYGKRFLTQKEHMVHRSFDKKKKRLTKMGYVQGSSLTEKGKFAAQIFCDELLYGEIFATDLYQAFNTYQLLLVFATLVYEPNDKHEFKQKYKGKELDQTLHHLRTHSYLKTLKRFDTMGRLTAIVHPLYERKSFFDILFNTNLPEGNLMRFLRQLLDRIDQVKKATQDYELIQRLDGCKGLIAECLAELEVL